MAQNPPKEAAAAEPGKDELPSKVSRLFDFLDKSVTQPREVVSGEQLSKDRGGSGKRETAFSLFNTDSASTASAARDDFGLPKAPGSQTDSKTAALRKKVAALELIVEEKHQNLLALKKLFEQQEDAKRELKEKLEKKFSADVAKYEEAVDRQLKMVDKLLVDKSELTKKCDALTEEMKQAEKKFQERLEDQANQFQREAERQKRALLNAEKSRREAWQREKSQEIKELTIKGLEPEIQRLMDRHRDEKRKMHEKMQRALEEVRGVAPVDVLGSSRRLACLKPYKHRLQGESQDKILQLKENMAREQDDILERERAHHRRLMREQHEQFEQEVRAKRHRSQVSHLRLREERESHLAAVAEVERKWEAQKQKDIAAFDEQIQAAVEQERSRAREQLEQVSHDIDTLRQHHAAEIAQKLEEMKANDAEWEEKLAEKVEAETRRRLEAIKADLAEERDRQLDAVIEKMGREQLQLHQQNKKKIDEAVAHVRTESEARLKESANKNSKLLQDIEVR
ncbi:5-azacytidine induced protein 1 [Cystoisospora suis]|uniref:5-azacytidine induced protein 1 n=1 Tax=Cystoisospora suis TaxID=483139 RepID=A0A2C6L9D2_9APIC|nr:5-azacytidine induced protein 1 [Cystoisospora suis]